MKTLLRTAAFAAVLAAGLPLASGAFAGPAGDALQACLDNATTSEDHLILDRWIFAIISLHPGVASMSTVTDAQREDINKKAGALVTRLMAVDCAPQLHAAITKEGTDAVDDAFGNLGKVAMRDLMSDPKVHDGASGLAGYLDMDKIKAAMSANGG